MDIFNNAWVVGIGGGILSGLIVTWISRIIFSKKENSIYVQNLQSANNEVIYALRPAISENKFPSIEIISALIEANSRKFKVKRQDMYSIKQLSEELTKEIMDTSFISYDKKEELFQHLVNLYKEGVNEIKDTVVVKNNMEVQEYKKRLLNAATGIIGSMTTVAFFVITMFSYYMDSYKKILNITMFLPIFLIILILITFVVVLWMIKLERLVKQKSTKTNININNNGNFQ